MVLRCARMPIEFRAFPIGAKTPVAKERTVSTHSSTPEAVPHAHRPFKSDHQHVRHTCIVRRGVLRSSPDANTQSGTFAADLRPLDILNTESIH